MVLSVPCISFEMKIGFCVVLNLCRPIWQETEDKGGKETTNKKSKAGGVSKRKK